MSISAQEYDDKMKDYNNDANYGTEKEESSTLYDDMPSIYQGEDDDNYINSNIKQDNSDYSTYNNYVSTYSGNNDEKEYSSYNNYDYFSNNRSLA